MNALSPIESALGRFEATSPERLATASLQDRGDTKFVLASDRLEAVLEAVREHTTVVETDGRRSFSYRTVYFDTDDRRCYVDHQRGVRPRYKVRIREHQDRNVAFLEVKERGPGQVTHKIARPCAPGLEELDQESIDFIGGVCALDPRSLRPSATTAYTRSTLVASDRDERLTVDRDVHLVCGERAHTLSGIVTLELKQPRVTAVSPLFRTLRRAGVREVTFSKYCAAVALLAGHERSRAYRETLNEIKRLGAVMPVDTLPAR